MKSNETNLEPTNSIYSTHHVVDHVECQIKKTKKIRRNLKDKMKAYKHMLDTQACYKLLLIVSKHILTRVDILTMWKIGRGSIGTSTRTQVVL